MLELKAEGMDELVDVAEQITYNWDCNIPWWRGQNDASWDLIPSVYRDGLAAEEANFIGSFRRKAPLRHHRCPEENDGMGWLSLAQHYGLPTRLMDWTESLLVALYFATEERPDSPESSAIWALAPERLNKHQGEEEGIIHHKSEKLGGLSTDAFSIYRPPEQEANRKVLALYPSEADVRQMTQQAAFTIHGTPTPLNKLPGIEVALARIIIPRSALRNFRCALELFGISRVTLFPDLGNLAHEVAGWKFMRRPLKPAPAACDD